jgi:hypothetical protein
VGPSRADEKYSISAACPWGAQYWHVSYRTYACPYAIEGTRGPPHMTGRPWVEATRAPPSAVPDLWQARLPQVVGITEVGMAEAERVACLWVSEGVATVPANTHPSAT